MNGQQPGGTRTCECGCGRTFEVRADAPHKRFATVNCKSAYWRRARKAGEAALMAAKGAA